MTPEEHERLVETLGAVVSDLGEKHYSRTGVVHRAWSLLATAGTALISSSSGGDECRRCGEPLEQTTLGRRRVFCSDSCRKAWNR